MFKEGDRGARSSGPRRLVLSSFLVLLPAHGTDNLPRDTGHEEGGEPRAKGSRVGTSRQLGEPVHDGAGLTLSEWGKRW